MALMQKAGFRAALAIASWLGTAACGSASPSTDDPGSAGAASIAGAAGGVSMGGAGALPPMGGTGGVVASGGSAGASAAGGFGTGGAAASGGAGAGGQATGGVGGQATGGVGGQATGGVGGMTNAFPPVTDLASNGPFPTTTVPFEGPNCMIVRPTTLGEDGLLHPVILWANGTGGPTPLYAPAFDYWASHGFIVAAGNSINGQGSGAEMIGCLDYVYAQHTTPGSPFEGAVDVTGAGASGHSQGGGGAIMAGRDPRVVVTAPLQPYILLGLGGFRTASITMQTGPMLLLSGTLDGVAIPLVNQQPVFNTTNVPVFWANLVGAEHLLVAAVAIPTYREVMLAWYRLHLMGDEGFRGMFYGPTCLLCNDPGWIVQRNGIN